MTSDVKDLAVERIIDNMSNVEAWQNADIVREYEEFYKLYANDLKKISRVREPHKTEYLHYGEISEQMRSLEKTQFIENLCREASVKYPTDIVMGNGEFGMSVSYVHSRMAILTIKYIDDAYKNLDKSVAELQLLADDGDVSAHMMLSVVKVLNWKSK